MKKALFIVVPIVVVGGMLLPRGQRADRSFDTSIARPQFAAHHPRLLIDEAHYNVHALGSTFAPFADLMRNDGWIVAPNRRKFTSEALRGAKLLVIANAAGGSNPKLFGLNLVPLRRGERGGPAFTAAEIEAIRKWVHDGGSLLLIADHAPFGSAAAALASAFGVTMHGGMVEVPAQNTPGMIAFSHDNGLLAINEITSGVTRICSFTGQSLTAPPSTTLLRLPADAVEFFPQPQGNAAPAGNAQAVALSYGRGRVAIFGEAAMLTAQLDDRGRPFGMNVSGCHNRQFALNVVRWLGATAP